LAAAGVLGNKCGSCYPEVGPEVACSGGNYMDIAIDAAHLDGKLVTALAWSAHPAWLVKFLGVLGTRIEP
jgi:protease I